MAINELRPVLIGADPMRIEHLWQTMYCTTFYRGGPILTSCISGIEQALWDIKGKKLGAPVYELIGGRVRDKIRMYSHTGGDTPEQAAANAKKRVEQGFDAVKISPTRRSSTSTTSPTSTRWRRSSAPSARPWARAWTSPSTSMAASTRAWPAA